MKLLDWIPLDMLNYRWFSGNQNAIHIFEANPDKIGWCYLSRNPNAIHLLEANPDKIDWELFSANITKPLD